jgi:hypothetical protein
VSVAIEKFNAGQWEINQIQSHIKLQQEKNLSVPYV